MRVRRRGATLLLALLFTVMATTAALMLTQLLPRDALSNRLATRDLTGTLVAEAGIRDIMARFASRLQAGVEPLSTATASFDGTFAGWNWKVQAAADSQTPPVGGGGLRMYKLRSVASLDGKERREVLCWLQAGETMAKYALFLDQGSPSLWDLLAAPGVTTLKGPFHHNGTLKIAVPDPVYTSNGPKPFIGKVSSAGFDAGSPDGFTYMTTTGYSAPYSSANGYDKLNGEGRNGMEAGVAPLPMPTSSLRLKEAAWGSSAPATPPSGVTVNPAGGVYIGGDADKVEMKVVNGNAETTITQGGTISTVTRVTDTAVGAAPIGSRRLVVNGTESVVPGLGSGVTFCTGNIASLKGTNKGAQTLAVDFSAGKSIEITGNILRADTAAGSEPTSTRDKLGLVANVVRMTDDTSLLPRTSGSVTHLYASFYCFDRFEVEQYDNPSLGVGRLQIFGGLQAKNKGGTMTFITGGPNIGDCLSGFGGPSGRGGMRLVSDPTLMTDPPPLYPASEKGKMVIRYWKERNLE